MHLSLLACMLAWLQQQDSTTRPQSIPFARRKKQVDEELGEKKGKMVRLDLVVSTGQGNTNIHKHTGDAWVASIPPPLHARVFHSRPR